MAVRNKHGEKLQGWPALWQAVKNLVVGNASTAKNGAKVSGRGAAAIGEKAAGGTARIINPLGTNILGKILFLTTAFAVIGSNLPKIENFFRSIFGRKKAKNQLQEQDVYAQQVRGEAPVTGPDSAYGPQHDARGFASTPSAEPDYLAPNSNFASRYAAQRSQGTPENWGQSVGGPRMRQGSHADQARQPVGAGQGEGSINR